MPAEPEPCGPQKGLGRALRHLREEATLSRQDLAERAGLSASWLSRVESGEEDPPWGDMRRVASGLGVSLEQLAELAEQFEEGDLL